ncbi:unnamed protein product [Lactuca saligna]|uniref:CW-type domain-containing protein n=1 Tax=Lactuca saligna TaxID=75948 RepID=A0AA35VRL4_LACSI|nr:unnamed protein product [Lactuca saligna]
MQSDYLTDTLSVYLESCEPLSVTDNDPSHNVDEPNTGPLVDPFTYIVLTESSEVRDYNYVQNIKCSSTWRSTRKVTMNQKTDTKLVARKSKRASGKKPMLDLLSADVGRRRISAWVCSDDCHKWRRISGILADSIESTECRCFKVSSSVHTALIEAFGKFYRSSK